MGTRPLSVCAAEECEELTINKYHNRDCRWKAQSARRRESRGFEETPAAKEKAEKKVAKENLAKVAQLLADNDIDPQEIGSIKGVRVSKWDALARGEMHTDEDGKKYREATRKVEMEGLSLILHPTWANGPAWELPHPPDPINVTVPTAPRGFEPVSLLTGWKTALLVPDQQYGYRRDLYTAELDPFHDERAIDVALQIADIERPDLTIFLGDVLDFAPFGKYRLEPGFALTIQPTLEAAYGDLAKFMAFSKEGRMIEGNHDVRLQNMIIDNAKAAFGIKRAGAPPEEWPVMSVPFLLNLDDLGVEYVGGYPSGATYINDNVAAIHGRKVGNDKRSAATMVVEDERVSVVFGHVHRIETTYRTRNTRDAPKISMAHTPGCLCRIDGAVPSVKGGIDAFGRAVQSWENWQTGISVVRYQEGDGKFKIENTPIVEGWALYEGQEITSRVSPEWAQ